LIILNIRNKKKNFENFTSLVKKITKEIFIPIGVGGGVENFNDVKKLLRCGADKIVVNNLLLNNRKELKKIAKIIGRQSIIASIDVIKRKNSFYIYDNDKSKVTKKLKDFLKDIPHEDIGEIYITSIDRDGTGQGYQFEIIDKFKSNFKGPIIISGGAGNWKHLLEGLTHKNINAVSTANLLNFIGDGFKNSRIELLKKIDLPKW
tara:strand:- start:29 stop:643 length:615 start_codon:yes stop_codon:yes gene_type:complete